MINYIAHTANSQGKEQSMKEHLEGVASLMESFALSDEYKDIYRFCGLIHDLGKYNPKFQDYLRGKHKDVPHSIWGAYYAHSLKLINISFPVLGHHGGLPNRSHLFDSIKLCNLKEWEFIRKAFDEDDLKLHVPNNSVFDSLKEITEKELFVRMLYSSLVDSDSLDTERHSDCNRYNSRTNIQLDVNDLILKLNLKFDAFAKNSQSNSELNILRNKVRLYAQNKSDLPLGCFSMMLPTGMGKTLCSINWALHHAKTHDNIKRIIIVLPFLSIIDQTVSELKSIFAGDDLILEHHSNVVYNPDEDNEDFYSINPKQLASENWDYPIIITTAVQFFDSLFSNKRSKCRKLHNIQDSIVIFDEIQTLPLKLSECTMTMLNDLINLCHCSILLCTATMPDFKNRNDFKGISQITSLVEDPQYIFDKTKRVLYHSLRDNLPISIEEVSQDIIAQNESVLVISNTKNKALEFYQHLSSNSSIKTVHISTNMCPCHRLEVINDIKDTLRRGEKIIVCSTQLIEAGVDLDFPIVYREIAPLESIIQSAGRCNRNQNLRGLGNVYIFQLQERGMPNKEYQSFAQFAQLCYKNNLDRLNNADFYAEYYKKILSLFVERINVTEDRIKLNYESVAQKYRIIDNETQALFVYNYNDESRELYDLILNKEHLSRNDYQRIGKYCVNVYDNFVRENLCRISVKNMINIWMGSYDINKGLNNQDEFYCL